MPRTQRKASSTGFYHVVTKGDGDQIIFEDDGDRLFYLRLFAKAMAKFGIAVHAYVLMDNHTHALLEEPKLDLSQLSSAMKTLNENYAGYFRDKTERAGHVFQGRFWSEPVENDAYYLCAARYIHANPEAAGLCRADEYRWSSMGAYLGRREPVDVTTTSLLLGMLGGVEAFRKFSADGTTWVKPFPGSRYRSTLSLSSLAEVAKTLLGADIFASLSKMSPVERQPHIEKLAEHGFSVAQICRLTGIGRSSVDLLLAR